MLSGKGVLVTRPAHQAGNFSKQLEGEGAIPILFPTTKIVADPVGKTQLLHSLTNLKQYDWIIFTSQNAVTFFWEQCEKSGLSSDHFKTKKIAAIGPATKQKLNDLGLTVNAMPDIYIGEEIVKSLGELRNQHILLPRAEGARTALVDELIKAGAIVNQVQLYKSVTNSPEPETWQNLEKEVHFVTFTSVSTVEGFFELLKDRALPYLQQRFVACIGPITADSLAVHGINTQIIAKSHTTQGLVEAMKAFLANTKLNG